MTWSVTCHTGSHGVTCHPTQVKTPHLNPSQTGQYSIYLRRRDGRLSWPRWLVTYRDVYLPTHPSKYSPGPVSINYIDRSQCAKHSTMPPPIYTCMWQQPSLPYSHSATETHKVIKLTDDTALYTICHKPKHFSTRNCTISDKFKSRNWHMCIGTNLTISVYSLLFLLFV